MKTYAQSKIELYELIEKIIYSLKEGQEMNVINLYDIAGSKWGLGELSVNKRLILLENRGKIELIKKHEKILSFTKTKNIIKNDDLIPNNDNSTPNNNNV